MRIDVDTDEQYPVLWALTSSGWHSIATTVDVPDNVAAAYFAARQAWAQAEATFIDALLAAGAPRLIRHCKDPSPDQEPA